VTTEGKPRVLAYGHHRLVPGADTIVGWGARCIYSEVMDGGQGVVYDRQDAFGPKDLFESLLSPAIDAWFTGVRRRFQRWDSGSDEIYSDDTIQQHDGRFYRIIIHGSPQRSYGYLYVTALLEEA